MKSAAKVCTDVMKELGSESGQFTPEPPAQWKWQIRNGDPVDKLLGIIREESTGKTPPRAWTKSLTTQRIAEKMHCSLGHAKNTLAEGIAQGRVLRKGGGVLGVAALIKPPKPEPPLFEPDDEPEGEGKGNEKSPVQVPEIFENPDILLQIKALRPKEQKAAISWGKKFDKWADLVFAAKAAEARRIIHEAKYSALPAIGVKATPKAKPEQLILDLQPPPVPEIFQAPVQVPTAVTRTGDESAPVQMTHIKTDLRGERSAYSSSSSSAGVSQSAGTDRPTETPSIAYAIPTDLQEQLGEIPSPALLKAITAALQGAPPQRLGSKIEQVRRARPKYITSLGLLLELAKDVGNAWAKGAKERAEVDESAQRAEERERLEKLDMARRMVNDPAADDEDRKWARDLLAGEVES